jgi:hypothetical protein
MVAALVWLATPRPQRGLKPPIRSVRSALYERGWIAARHEDAGVTDAGLQALRDAGHDRVADAYGKGVDVQHLGTFRVAVRQRDGVLVEGVDEHADALLERLRPGLMVELRMVTGGGE